MNQTIEVWHATAAVDRPGPVEQWCERFLNAEDRRRADQFRRPTTRNQHVVGRGMAKRLIGGGSAGPDDWIYHDLPGGKPRLRSSSAVGTSTVATDAAFNVSHTEGLVVCGIVRGEPSSGDHWIGIDVERGNRRIDLAMTERYFAKPEIEFVRDQPTERAAKEAFLRIWTLKESFIKAIGTGLRTPLADFTFDRVDTSKPTIRFLDNRLAIAAGGSPDQWQFVSLQPRPGFIAAVGIRSGGPVQTALQDFDALVETADGPLDQ